MRIHTLEKKDSGVALQRLMDHSSVLFIVAENGNGDVIGGMTLYVLPSLYTEKDYYYIYDMGCQASAPE